jgi:hypothetical protein
VGLPKTAVADWQRSYRKLFKLVKLPINPETGKPKRAHPHMFRDTFAIEMLLSGARIEEVSRLLGHKSVGRVVVAQLINDLASGSRYIAKRDNTVFSLFQLPAQNLFNSFHFPNSPRELFLPSRQGQRLIPFESKLAVFYRSQRRKWLDGKLH